MTSVAGNDGARIDRRGHERWALGMGAALVVAYLAFLVTRRVGSYSTAVDGWGVDAFELATGVVCMRRYVESSWHSSRSAARTFPLVLGAACLSWGAGDTALTVEHLGGATPSVPSAANFLWAGFFPLCYVAFMMLVRRGNNRSLVATSLDGLVAGLGVVSLSAAFVFSSVLAATGKGALAAATGMVYPLGDLLLLSLAVGGLVVLPREYRLFLSIACVAFAANATGDTYNLLQPNSKIGYVTNAVAWPISLLMLAIATWVHPAVVGRAASERDPGFTLPAIGALAGMFVLFAASVSHVGRAALGLATATLLVAGVRLTLTVRQAQALRSARFRSLIDHTWDVILVAGADLLISYVTPSSERMLGHSPESLAACLVTEIAHPSDVEALAGGLRALAATPGATVVLESRMRHVNGEWRTIAWTATNLLADPSVRGYVMNGADVTEARRAAEDLAAARDGALMASKAKSEFLSTMSHEIRTPMNGVIGLTELLLQTALDADQHELASGVKISAENLLVIINDILDFSKIEAGKLDLEEAPLDVPGVVDDVGRILAGAAHAKGVELLVDIHPDVPGALLGDPVRIQQVLLNLASNAVKFTPAGEVVIRVAVLDESGERVALRFDIIDMGIGIALADQERLFGAFSQADSSTTRKFGGTGLGLAISRQLVELMGGTLGLVSAPGEGSTFWFEVSLRRSQRDRASSARNGLTDLAGTSALVVDDNATNRMILRQQFLSWDVETAEAADGYEALELAAAAARAGRCFDVGVVDLNMPGMDGIELARTLKADPATAQMALFLLSSSGERLGAGESHLRGFAGSLTKPVRSSELFDCLISGINADADPRSTVSPTVRQQESHKVLGMILLVEDNKMNQLVGSKVLAKLGYDFAIADDGRQAVDALQGGQFDAILMDCQMPEMDGYEATAEIRRREGTARHTPIIAMTAAAMDGDRERCLAAGMDDYITKPVRLEAVADALTRWVERSDESAAASESAAEGESASEGEQDMTRRGDELAGALDESQIELLRSLDDGDGAVLAEIVEQYLRQTAEGRGEIVRVVDAGDTSALERAAHALRGASANVGASALAAVCAEMELAGRIAKLDGAAGLVERFDVEFARVREALSQLGSGG